MENIVSPASLPLPNPSSALSIPSCTYICLYSRSLCSIHTEQSHPLCLLLSYSHPHSCSLPWVLAPFIPVFPSLFLFCRTSSSITCFIPEINSFLPSLFPNYSYFPHFHLSSSIILFICFIYLYLPHIPCSLTVTFYNIHNSQNISHFIYLPPTFFASILA